MGFTCVICIEHTDLGFQHNHNCDNISLTSCDPNICLLNCAPNICLTCLASHINAKIDENAATIKCPSCDKTLNPVECRQWIPVKVFLKWCDNRRRLSVLPLEHRYCPNKACSELILNECNETVEKCACPRCKALLCYKCMVQWHAGFRCSEFSQELTSDDRKFLLLVEQRKWTRCPGCGQPTERIDGCTHVKCRCGKRFNHSSNHPLAFCGEVILFASLLFLYFCIVLW